jgi:hypothetical protein
MYIDILESGGGRRVSAHGKDLKCKRMANRDFLGISQPLEVRTEIGPSEWSH